MRQNGVNVSFDSFSITWIVTKPIPNTYNYALDSTLSSLINVMFLINVMVLNKVSYHHVFLFTAIYFLIRRDGRKFFSRRNKRAARLLGSLEYFLRILHDALFVEIHDKIKF